MKKVDISRKIRVKLGKSIVFLSSVLSLVKSNPSRWSKSNQKWELIYIYLLLTALTITLNLYIHSFKKKFLSELLISHPQSWVLYQRPKVRHLLPPVHSSLLDKGFWFLLFLESTEVIFKGHSNTSIINGDTLVFTSFIFHSSSFSLAWN